MNTQRADELAAALGAQLGIPGLCFNAARSCQLVFDKSWDVTMIHDVARQRVTLNCSVVGGEQCRQLSRQTLLVMLQANFMEQGSPSATLSIGPDQLAYLQTTVMLSEANDKALHISLELLLNHAEVWTARLLQDTPTTGQTDPPPTSPLVRPSAPTGWARQRV